MKSELALLLALAIGGIALSAGQTLTDPLSNNFTCPGGGTAYDGNNRPEFLPACAGASVICRVDCPGIGDCPVICNGGTVLMLSVEANGKVTITNESLVEVKEDKGIFAGCDAYCVVPRGATSPAVPVHLDGSVCGLSHADFCYTPPPPLSSPPPPPLSSPPPPPLSSPPPPPLSSPPPPPRSSPPPGCQCVKNGVKFYHDGLPLKDISLCPGKPLPDSRKYTAVDNCGKTLPVSVYDSKRRPSGCCSITRKLSVDCSYAKVKKDQTIKYEDRITFTSSCPVKASSCTLRNREVIPVVSYTKCVFQAVYKVKNACGKWETKTDKILV